MSQCFHKGLQMFAQIQQYEIQVNLCAPVKTTKLVVYIKTSAYESFVKHAFSLYTQTANNGSMQGGLISKTNIEMENNLK